MTTDYSHPSLEIRSLKQSDFKALKALQLKCFPDMEPYGYQQFRSQLKHFREGQTGVFYEGTLIGSGSTLILDLDEYSADHTWEEIADDGFIRNHDPEGDTLYGIEVMVDPEYRNMKIGRRIYEERKNLCREWNLRRILVGGRLPNYHKYQKKMDIYAYVRSVMNKKISDPVLTFQLKNDFVVKRIIRNYLKEDTDSGGYAALLEWTNFEYQTLAPKQRITSMPVRICCVQYQMRKIESFDDFTTQVEYFVDVASDYKSDFVLFPELLTTQLLSFEKEKRPGLASRELAKYTDQYIKFFQDMALSYNVNIIGGSHFTLEKDHVFNVSYLFRRDGTIDKQYKIHITPSESLWWGVQSGSTPKVFDTDRGKIAINICYDVEFPEMARFAVDNGAHILFVPYCTDERHGFTRVRTCAQARAIENQIFVAMAGTTGNIPSVENLAIQYAQSAIFTPSDFPFSRDGIAAITDENAEMVVIADVDVEVLRRSRHSGTVMPLKDRRRDLYSIRFRDLPEYSRVMPDDALFDGEKDEKGYDGQDEHSSRNKKG
ncbi:MAG: bifunctional GNAT family N-acetyltransferase/carbon-nitrogen hydrolase family protein [Balneolales bacterium]